MASKKLNNSSWWIGFITVCATLLIFFSIPLVAGAATGTLGDETPDVHCNYYLDGKSVDGNKLTAGNTYNVDIVLSGVQSFSVFQVTGTYDSSVVTVNPTAISLASQTVQGVDSMGYLLEGGNIVFGFVSTNDDCTVLDGEAVMATFAITVSSDCDAADYIKIQQSPNNTFVLADYGDGYNDSYSLVTEYEGYNGHLYKMTEDVTPSLGHSVSGNLVVMTGPKDKTNDLAVNGEYQIDLYSDADCTQQLPEYAVHSVQSDVDGKKVNTFTLNNLPDGTYYAQIKYKYAVTRTITIKVNGTDLECASIPIINCDFDGNGYITTLDKRVLTSHLTETDNADMDLDGNGVVTTLDGRITVSLMASTYSDFTIE